MPKPEKSASKLEKYTRRWYDERMLACDAHLERCATKNVTSCSTCSWMVDDCLARLRQLSMAEIQAKKAYKDSIGCSLGS